MKKLLILMGVLSIIFVAGCSESSNSNNEKVTTNANADNSGQKQEKEVKKKDNSKLTLKKFNKVKTNMTYEQVVKILGSKGKVLSESEVAGIKTVMYQWDGTFGANMNATFQKDKLVSKAQFGLE